MKKKSNVSKKPAASGAKPTYSSFVPAENIVHHAHSEHNHEHEFSFSWTKVLLAGIAFGVISEVLHTVDSIFTMGYYTDPQYFAIWSKVMMPTNGPPPASFFVLTILLSIITGLILAYVFAVVRSSLKQSSALKTGIAYGAFVFLLTAPVLLSTYVMIAIPPMLLADWAVWSFIISLVGCTAIAKIMG
jgi:hypothetical protein